MDIQNGTQDFYSALFNKNKHSYSILSHFTHQIFEKCILGLLEGLSSCCWTFQFSDMLTLCMNCNVSFLLDVLGRRGIENSSFKSKRNMKKKKLNSKKNLS